VQIFKPSNVEVVFTYSVLTISLGSNLIAIDSDFVGLLAIYILHTFFHLHCLKKSAEVCIFSAQKLAKLDSIARV
jgi:hypothetical protein